MEKTENIIFFKFREDVSKKISQNLRVSNYYYGPGLFLIIWLDYQIK